MKYTSVVLATFASAAGAMAGIVARPNGLTPVRMAARASTCNGDASLCTKKYSNVTFVGSHNSYAIGTQNVAAEQSWNVTQQLEAGVRMLQAQAHTKNSTSGSGIELCHTSCSLLDGGTLEAWLAEIKTWADANPNEVLSLLLVNQESIAPSKFATAFNSSGISSLAYSPSGNMSSKDDWPTLGSMIDSSKRIVTYLSAGADSSVPWLLSEFDSMWETPYDQTSLPFNCSIDRKGQGATTSEQMYLVNHYKDQTIAGFVAPDRSSAASVNAEEEVLENADSCAAGAGNGAYPNFILIDFVGEGNSSAWQGPFQAAAQMNGIKYPAPTIANTSSSSSTSASSQASSSPASPVAVSSVLLTVSITLLGAVALL